MKQYIENRFATQLAQGWT